MIKSIIQATDMKFWISTVGKTRRDRIRSNPFKQVEIQSITEVITMVFTCIKNE
jgi:hypothetical protein